MSEALAAIPEPKTGDIIVRPLDWEHGPEWMACDARELRRTRYPDLFAVMGTTYGSAGDQWFRLPLLDESPYPGPVGAQCYIYVGP